MPITRTPMIDDDGSGQTGTILNNAWKQQLYDQIDASPAWVDVPFVAANFTATSGGPWVVSAGNALVNAFIVHGKMLTWSIYINGSSLTATAAGLKIALPAFGATISKTSTGVFAYQMAGLGGYAWGTLDNTGLTVFRNTAAPPFDPGALTLTGTIHGFIQ